MSHVTLTVLLIVWILKIAQVSPSETGQTIHETLFDGAREDATFRE